MSSTNVPSKYVPLAQHDEIHPWDDPTASNYSSTSSSEPHPWDEDFETAVDESGCIPTAWLVFCYILVSLVIIGALAVAIGCPIGFGMIERDYSTAYAMVAGLVITSIAAGVCAPIAVSLATSKSVIPWTIVHLIFFALNLTFLIVNELCRHSNMLGTVIAGPMCAFQLIFCAVYGPLATIKNLRRHHSRCDGHHP